MSGQAARLGIVLGTGGLAVGYLTSLPYFDPTGRVASALVGMALGLALARALWITRHGEGWSGLPDAVAEEQEPPAESDTSERDD